MSLCQFCERAEATRAIVIICGQDTPEGEWFVDGNACDECADDLECFDPVEVEL